MNSDIDPDFEWNPPTPPWNPEPEPLSIESISQPESPEFDLEGNPIPGLEPPPPNEDEQVSVGGLAVDLGLPVRPPTPMYNGKPAWEEFNQESEDVNGTELDGFFFYRILSPSGITLNGTPYPQGAYWFDQKTYDGIEAIDSNAAL